jgi:hypothetical protein
LEELLAEIHAAVAEGSPTVCFSFLGPEWLFRDIVNGSVSISLHDEPDRSRRPEFDPPTRELIGSALFSPEFDNVERAIGIPCTASNFRTEVVETVQVCVWLHLMRIREDKLRRLLRKQWREVEKACVRAADGIDEVRDTLAAVYGWTEDAACRIADPSLERFDALTCLARSSSRFTKGGRPPMHAFAYLVRSLAATFERATTRKPIIYRNAVTSSYEGAFLVLVDAVLLRLLQLARELGYPPIAQPVTAEARGLFIVLTLRWTKTPTPAEN